MKTISTTRSNKLNALVLCPYPHVRGGVTSYYTLIRKYFVSELVNLDFFYVGKDKAEISLPRRYTLALADLFNLARVLLKYDLIILNPSLDFKSIVRDGIYNFIARYLFRRKTLVFFHGWGDTVERKITKFGKSIFRKLFNFDRAVVLALQFKNTLVNWGFDPESIGLETTIYEESIHEGKNNPSNILFLSRFTKGKGCLETIQTVEILSERFPGIKLYMAGDGEMSPDLHEYVDRKKLSSIIEFTGWVDGERKKWLLNNCGIMLFPTSYGEGMPLCILEGMGMGLAIVTRPVAGITNVVSDGVNGFLVPSLQPIDFVSRVELLLDNEALWKCISERNRCEARCRYEVKNVVKRLEQLYCYTGEGC